MVCKLGQSAVDAARLGIWFCVDYRYDLFFNIYGKAYGGKKYQNYTVIICYSIYTECQLELRFFQPARYIVGNGQPATLNRNHHSDDVEV